MHTEHEGFMATALEEAKRARDLGNAAVGAVIVRDGELLSTGCNEVTSSFDITAHAEAAAIRRLTISRRQLNSGSSSGSTTRSSRSRSARRRSRSLSPCRY